MSGSQLPVFVRTAAAKDLQCVSDLLAVTWHATYDFVYGAEKVSEITRDWHSAVALQQSLTKPNSEFLLADDGKQILGMAFAASSGRIINLDQLYVLPGQQRRGIGAQLLDEVVACFFDADRIRLEVDPGNAGAIRFYQRHGFVEAGRTKNCGSGQSGIPALIFEKHLG